MSGFLNYGETDPTESNSFGIGENWSNMASSSRGQSRTENYGSDVWGPQAKYLKGLYKDSSRIGEGNQGQVQGLYDQSLDAYNSLLNPGMNPMMDVYSRQIGDQFREQIMPELQGQAAMVGGLGSSRAGIAQGLAGGKAAGQIQDFAAQLYATDQDRRLGALGLAPQMGQFGMQIPWYNLNQRAGIIGDPAMRSLGGLATSSNRASSSANESSYGYKVTGSESSGGGSFDFGTGGGYSPGGI